MYQSCSLLEREEETGIIASALRRVRSGSGAMVMFEGSEGLGKTSLLQVIRAGAEAEGFVVLQARGNALEQTFRWGMVRQLFERMLCSEASAVKDKALVGPAALVGGLFDYSQPVGTGLSGDCDDNLYANVHGLYWLCRNISEEQPVLLLMDDAHWADAESLRFVNYLANRLEGSGVLLALAHARSGPAETRDLLMSLYALPLVSHAPLAPLSQDAVGRRIAERLGSEPHERFAAECLRTTGGNPLHLTELLEEMRRRGEAPDESAIERLALLTPARLARHVLRQMGDLPVRTMALATAVAVLGADAQPQHCAAVARLEEAEAAERAGRLRDAGILRPGVPYAFRHPLAGQVIYADMPAHARSTAHRRAARSLHIAEAGAVAVAEHVCRTETSLEPWMVDVLSSAAHDEARSGRPGTAVRYLRRALAEPPPPSLRAGLLAGLGSAELRLRAPAALDHLRQALRHSSDQADGPRVRLELGLALAASGRFEESLAAFARAADSEATGPGAASAAGHARAVASVMTRLAPKRAGRYPAGAPGDGPPHRAHAAFEALIRGVEADRVARLATAVRGLPLPLHDTEITDAAIVAWTLAQCDRLHRAEHILTRLVREATERGWLLAAATAESLRAGVVLDAGRVREAEAVARGVLGDHDSRCLRPVAVPLAAATLVHCLIETERLEEASDFLKTAGLAACLPEAAHFVPLRMARARLRIHQDQPEAGLLELRECRERAGREGWDFPPAACAYLPDAARAVALTSGAKAARAVAREEMPRARGFGAARPLAVALRTYGERTGGEEGLRHLREAGRLLAASPYRLERGRTLVALGSALRRGGHRSDARKHLTDGLEIARTSGASALENSAREELRLAGARPGRARVSSPAALTPAEERVAQKAAVGLSNREISQALFVTVKTVEWHLSQTYAKLGIGRRAELPRALAGHGLAAD
ncbi:AAA family ATPase [Streptomyces sodiiphilus]|uniref:AAA family ATPase n=1 Tax=Streptomyces sodiiphilus TaxID=226217 RepID=A0ABP5A4L7_9ACTN